MAGGRARARSLASAAGQRIVLFPRYLDQPPGYYYIIVTVYTRTYYYFDIIIGFRYERRPSVDRSDNKYYYYLIRPKAQPGHRWRPDNILLFTCNL